MQVFSQATTIGPPATAGVVHRRLRCGLRVLTCPLSALLRTLRMMYTAISYCSPQRLERSIPAHQAVLTHAAQTPLTSTILPLHYAGPPRAYPGHVPHNLIP
ncbi:hypothetical protein PMIN06_012861 [Paraphaeosphaeria minitans]